MTMPGSDDTWGACASCQLVLGQGASLRCKDSLGAWEQNLPAEPSFQPFDWHRKAAAFATDDAAAFVVGLCKIRLEKGCAT